MSEDDRLKQIHELIQTIIDGANYVHQQIINGDLSMAIIVTEDIITGFVSIEGAITSMGDELKQYDVVDHRLMLVKGSLDKIVLSFETNAYQQVASIINRSLIKQLNDLRVAID